MEPLENAPRPEDTGARLRAVRELAGVSPREVARAAGISTRELAAVERGRRALSADELRSLAEAFAIDEQVLVTEGFVDTAPSTADADRLRAVMGHETDHRHDLPASPGDLPSTPAVDAPGAERRRDQATRKRVEDSWRDLRNEMEDLIRCSMQVATIGSGNDIREVIDALEIEIRRLKMSPKFLSAVARHERLITDVRAGSAKRAAPATRSR